MKTQCIKDVKSVEEIYNESLPKFARASLMGKTMQIHDNFNKHIVKLQKQIDQIENINKDNVQQLIKDVFRDYLE